MKYVILFAAFSVLLAAPLYAQQEGDTERLFVQSVRAAMEAEERPEAERVRDDNRLPAEMGSSGI